MDQYFTEADGAIHVAEIVVTETGSLNNVAFRGLVFAFEDCYRGLWREANLGRDFPFGEYPKIHSGESLFRQGGIFECLSPESQHTLIKWANYKAHEVPYVESRAFQELTREHSGSWPKERITEVSSFVSECKGLSADPAVLEILREPTKP